MLLSVPVGIGGSSPLLVAASSHQASVEQQELAAATTSLQEGDAPLSGVSTSCLILLAGNVPCEAGLDTTTTDAGWTEVSTAGPAVRFYHVMAYDAADGYVVLFEGQGLRAGGSGDTWKYSNGIWTNITGPGPAPKDESGMVYDAADGHIILLGGACLHYPWSQCETWSFLGGVWNKIATSTSPPGGSVLAYDAADGYIVWSGVAVNGTGLGPAYKYTPNTWKFSAGMWTNITSPGDPTGGSMVYDAADGYLVLFGGKDTWKFSAGTWTKITSTGPPDRYGPAIAYDTADGYVVLYGGVSGSLCVGGPCGQHPNSLHYSDTWKFLDGSWTNITSPGPSARSGASMVYDDADGYVVLFGGYHTNCCSSVDYSDTWKYSLLHQGDFVISASPVSMPIRRSGAADVTFTLTSLNGFSGNVNLSATITPVTPRSPRMTLNQSTLILSSGRTTTATLTVTPHHSPKGGSYTITMTATSGSIIHTITTTVTITSTRSQDRNIEVE